jgi:N4-gp56 family major capsid protein
MSASVTTIPHAINNYYDRLLLEREKPYLVHPNFGQVRNIPVGGTGVIKFRKYGALTANITPLTEGETPAGTNPSVTDITATALWYGDYITYTDKVTIESPDPVLTELTEVLGEQAGLSIDTLSRDVLVQGTNVLFADATSPKVNAQTSDVSATDVLEKVILDRAISTLRSANAKYITNFVSPDAGYLTTPVAPCFVGIVHPQSVVNLKAITGFVSVEQYANKGDVMPNEVGKYDRVRFVESTQAYVEEDGGNGSIDVYHTLIFGKDAYGVTSIQGNAMQMFITELGSSGSADPLKQRGTIGWKANHITKILNQSWMIRIEHAIV